MVQYAISGHWDIKDGIRWKKAPRYLPWFAGKHKNFSDLLYRLSYRSNSKDDHMQEVASLGRIPEEISLDRLWDCGKKNRHSHAPSPPNTQKEKRKTPEAQREQFVSPRDQNEEMFSTPLLQVQWLEKMHLQDTLNKKFSHLKHEQEGVKDNCSRNNNAICGSLPLNKN